ncbi:MAG: hypothetical protein K6F55_08130 [Eubacterium sp.]|nr:hypothetical protein [Eubacterium sp.]
MKNSAFGKLNNSGKCILSHMARISVLFVVMFLAVCFDRLSEVSAENAYKTVTVSIPFECKKTEDMNYSICIEKKSEYAPEPDQRQIDTKGSKTGSFRIQISEPGTFIYHIYQAKGTDSEIIYDDTQYDVYIYVTNGEDGEINYSTSVYYADTDDKPSSVEYGNSYRNPEDKEERTTEEADVKPEEDTTEKSTDKNTESGSEIPPSKKEESGKSTNAKTADETNVYMLAVLLAVSAAGSLLIIYSKSKKDNVSE